MSRGSTGKSLHLSVAEAHRLNIAQHTIMMPDAILGVMGGMSKADARQILGRIKRKRLTAKKVVVNSQNENHND